MVKYTYRTDARGIIWVTRPGEPEHVLTLGLKDAVVMDRVIARWEPLAKKHEARIGVPAADSLAMVWREAAGNPNAVNPENRSDPTDNGVGLFQITNKGLKRGLSDAALMDPETNFTIGTDYIAFLRKRYPGDFPKQSAAFNAGSVRPSDANPFGMYSTGNHIEAEVAARNYYLMRSAPPEAVTPTRIFTDEETKEVLAQVAVSLDEFTRSEDFGARDMSEDARDTDPAPPLFDDADAPTSPQTPRAKSEPPRYA